MEGSMFREMIEEALLNTHTAFCAKVIQVSENTATIQPLNMIKAVGKQAKRQAVLQHVPILQNAKKFKIKKINTSREEIQEESHSHEVEIWEVVGVEKDDIVYCLCAERDITEARRGNFSIPPTRHHELSDAIIIGIL